MFDRELVLDSLINIRTAIDTILERTAVVSNPDEFLHSQDGMMRLACYKSFHLSGRSALYWLMLVFGCISAVLLMTSEIYSKKLTLLSLQEHASE